MRQKNKTRMHGTSGPSQFHKGISEETRRHIFQDVPVKM